MTVDVSKRIPSTERALAVSRFDKLKAPSLSRGSAEWVARSDGMCPIRRRTWRIFSLRARVRLCKPP